MADMQLSGFGSLLSVVASTPKGGVTQPDSTGPLLSWTAPADGAEHTVLIAGEQSVSSALTGGAIAVTFNSPDGANGTVFVIGANNGISVNPFSSNGVVGLIIPAGSTVQLNQYVAASAGAAKVYAKMWAA